MTQDDLSVESTIRLLAHIMREGHEQVAVKILPDYLDQVAQTIEDLRTELAVLRGTQAPHNFVHVPKTDSFSDETVDDYMSGYWEAG